MSKKMTTYEFDVDALPPLSEKERAELKALDKKSEVETDLSDIPGLNESFWSSAVQPGVYKPMKASTTVRVDADVLLWLRSKGKGYQTRINAILRAAMLRDLNDSSRG